MAIQINTTVQTADGFSVQPFAFLDIQLYQPFSRALITYYKDQASYEAGQSPVTVPSLPTLSDSNLTANEFWGTDLAMTIHEKAILVIEEVTGVGTCNVVSLEA